MEYSKILYKKDSKGKYRSLLISTLNGELRQESGLLDGKKVLHTSMCTPKNVGRSNETTSQEQAVLEAQSKIKSKRDEGYFDTQSEAEDGEVILPMLAKDMKKESKKIDWSECYVQPKLDGCLKFNSLIDTDQGFIEIGRIVNEKLNLKVKSFNEKLNIFEYKKIINFFDNGCEKTINFRTIVTEDNDKLTCTKNHKLYTKNGWKRTDELTNEDSILKNQDKNFTGGLLGIFLGDGTIYKDKRTKRSYKFQFSHSEKQSEYVKHKIEFLNKDYTLRNKISGYGSNTIIECYIKGMNNYYNFIETLVDKEGRRKLLNYEFLRENLTAQGLAFWIGDDGNLALNNGDELTPILTISTHAYSTEQLEIFSEYFTKIYNVTPTFILDKRINCSSLTFNTKDTLYLLNMLKYNIPRGVEYKFYFNERPFEYKCFHNKMFKKVNRVLKVKGSKLNKYDIEVEDNHNYIAEGMLVHNCRALREQKGLISRKGKEIETLPHINRVTKGIPEILDGEIYKHGSSFQENMELIKKSRPESIDVKYHVYDIVSNKPFIERYKDLTNIVSEIDDENLKLVPTFKVSSLEEVQKYHSKFLAEGYEGTMIRWGSEPYKVNGRSSNLLKYKDFQDLVCKVVDILPSDRNPKQGVVQCILNGEVFGCGMKFSHVEREEILQNKSKYIGQTAEIRFFEYTDGGLPRFPVCVGFRLDK